MRNQKGFTLIEMMIVLFVISILLLITIPNVTKNHKTISDKGCDGMVNMVQSQVQAYYIENNDYPDDIGDLVGDYLQSSPKCPDGRRILLDGNQAYVENAS